MFMLHFETALYSQRVSPKQLSYHNRMSRIDGSNNRIFGGNEETDFPYEIVD